MSLLHFPPKMSILAGFACLGMVVASALGQEKPAAGPAVTQPPQPGTLANPNEPVDKRVFGVLPNYRTAQFTNDYTPISARIKMRIALKDSFDYPLVLLAAVDAGFYQINNSHPQFGQGVKGYARRLGTSYSDQVVGNMLTEGILPIAFHEDPRYFRLGDGTKSHRTFYALTRIFVTRTDAGGRSFNFAEVVGNGTSAGVSLLYYTDSRNPADYFQIMGTSLATDAISQVLKEFWPDVKRRFFKRNATDQQAAK